MLNYLSITVLFSVSVTLICLPVYIGQIFGRLLFHSLWCLRWTQRHFPETPSKPDILDIGYQSFDCQLFLSFSACQDFHLGGKWISGIKRTVTVRIAAHNKGRKQQRWASSQSPMSPRVIKSLPGGRERLSVCCPSAAEPH